MRELPLRTAGLSAATAGCVLVFLFAVQLLGAATDAAAPALRPVLGRVVVGDSVALGLSWLAAYGLANGSVVAALSLSLFNTGLITATDLFLMIVGSRLGAAAVVVFVGLLDYVQEDGPSMREAVSLGMLTFLLTHTIYLPVAVLGYVTLPTLTGPVRSVSEGLTVGIRPLAFFDPAVAWLTDLIGPAPAFVLAVVSLFVSLRLFDRVLSKVETATLRDELFTHLQYTWLSFAIGVLITTVTTSVAFSLGVIVPLYNRGYVKREELIPYVLGANLGTLFDTLVVAIVLQTAVGVATVLVLLAIGTALTVLALLADDSYTDRVEALDDRLLEDRRLFVAFAAALVVVPVALVAVPLVFR